ncbi:MAG: hypothetical protein ACP6IY_10770 [Promethearchaeia archaeon]
MTFDFYNPPPAILASGTKEGVELGGSKLLVSIDSAHNFFSEGTIYTEMSWATFYEEEDLSDQIDMFMTKEFQSVRDDPDKLVKTISSTIYEIINHKKLFYGIMDFECDAFMNENSQKYINVKIDYKFINSLMETHKKLRDENLFPQIIKDEKRVKKIKINFDGEKKKNLVMYGSKLEDFAQKLHLAKGFATGIVCTSEGAANLYIITDNIVFSEDEYRDLYIDQNQIKFLDWAIKERGVLFPISWFRIDIGIRSLETLELWDDIKDNKELKKALNYYDRYILGLILKKYKPENVGIDLEDDFYRMTPEERRKALKDMAEAIRILTKKYKE